MAKRNRFVVKDEDIVDTRTGEVVCRIDEPIAHLLPFINKQLRAETKSPAIGERKGKFEVRWTGTAPFSGGTFEVHEPFSSYNEAREAALEVTRRPKVGVTIAVQYRDIRIVEYQQQNSKQTASVIERFD